MVITPRVRAQRVPLTDQVGLAALGGAAVLLIGLGVLAVRHLPDGVGQEIGVLVLIVAVVVGAFLLLQAAPRAAVWTLEDVTGRDVDGDGHVGEPGGDIRFLPLRSNNVTNVDDTWRAFITECANDRTSERYWHPIIGEKQYTEWRNLLMKQGYAAWRNTDERQGWRLTATADEVLAACEPRGE